MIITIITALSRAFRRTEFIRLHERRRRLRDGRILEIPLTPVAPSVRDELRVRLQPSLRAHGGNRFHHPARA